jgi:hypothetical protein
VAARGRPDSGDRRAQVPNYPGSTYTLVYLPEWDSLAGYYYRAALNQTFDVVLVRVEGIYMPNWFNTVLYLPMLPYNIQHFRRIILEYVALALKK